MGFKNDRIKKANTITEYTPEQVLELKRCASDPVYFIKNYVQIQHPVKGAIPFKLYDYQENMIRKFQEHRFTVTLSARQTGKALALDTPIPTPLGWTTMGEIEPGDRVLDARGRSVDVINTSPIMTNHECYRVTFDTGDSVIADADHLWEVRDEYTRKVKVVTTEHMKSVNYTSNKNQARFTVKTTKPLQLPTQHLQVDPYLLGVWLGDGTSNTGEITTHIDDLIIYDFIDPNTKFYHIDDGLNKKRTTVPKLRTNLRLLDLLQNKHIPIEYKRASYAQRLQLLQGLMDTDGYVDSIGRGQCELTLANERLSDDSYELITSLGLKAYKKTRIVKGFIRYEIKFSAYRDDIQVFRLPRKLNNMKQSPPPTRKYSTKKRSIKLIERVGSVPVRCITVDNDDHLFLFGYGMIPTHNSITSASYLLWFSIFHFEKTILIASNKNTNAMEMISRIRYSYENLPMWLKPGISDDGWNKHSIGFDNGSRILSEATSETSGRGLSISLVFLDEFAFVAANIQSEFWTSISPTLATGGSCIMTSTPNGDTNIFAEVWRGAQVGANGFEPIYVAWDEPPGRDEKFKEEAIAQIGERMWQQEYNCFGPAEQMELKFDDGSECLMTPAELMNYLNEIN